MNGYDFDKTIYKTDSSTDFFVYMILHRPYLLLFAPWFLIVLALYGMKILSKKKMFHVEHTSVKHFLCFYKGFFIICVFFLG